MAALTLEQLLGNVSSYQQGSEAATKQVLAALDTQSKIAQSTADTFTQQASDDRTVQEAKNAADYATQLARVKAANAFGTNLKDSSEVVTGLAAAAQDAFTRKEEALKRIQEKESVNFLDHPIDYLVNQFTINRDISAHNIANQQMQDAQDRIQAINANTQSTVQTQNAISEPLTAASMEASARSAAVAATVNANQAKIQGLQYNVQGIQAALNAKKDVLGLMFQANQAQNAAESLSLQRQGLDLNKQEFEFRKKEFQDKQDDKHEQQRLGQDLVDTINLGRKALLGPNAEPLDDISGRMALAALKGKGTLSVELQKYYDAGERTRLTGTVTIGGTPAAAAETLQTVPVQLNPTQGAIKSLLGQAARDTSMAIKNADIPGANKDPVFVGIDKKDKNSINAAFNAHAQQLLNAAAKVIKPGDADNPYQIASVNQLAATSPTVRELTVYQKVLKPLVDTGVQLNDPKQVMQVVGDAVAKGTITHRQALEMTTIYHVGVAANLAMRNFQGFGLKPSYSYNAKVTTDPTAWHTDEVVNMTDPGSVSRALVKLQAGMLRRNSSIVGAKSRGEDVFPFNLSIPDSALQFGPKTNYPASEERMQQADEAYARGWK
jgi:hypothetical protein